MAQSYKIYGTNQPYSGKVLNLGNRLYTTEGGALEGTSKEVVLSGGGNTNPEESLPTMNSMNQLSENTNQDVVTAFIVGDNSQFGRATYYYANGNRVLQNTKLHHHTVPPNSRNNFMTQHTMDGNEQDVFTLPPNNATNTTTTFSTMGGPTGTNAQEMGELGNMGVGGGISPDIGNQGGDEGTGGSGGGMGGGY